MTDLPPTLLDLLESRPATLARSRLLCIDGTAGSGKTTLAAATETAARTRGWSVCVVHLDDVLRGWDGLAELGPRVDADIVGPLSRGRAGSYARYDWHAGRTTETQHVPPADLVVLEGVGAGHLGYAHRIGVLVFADAPAHVRLARGLARDGAGLEPQWRSWLHDERALHRAECTETRADILVNGVTGYFTRRPAPPAQRQRGPRSGRGAAAPG